MLSDVRGWRVSEWSGRSIFIFFLKKKIILILLARNLPFDSDVVKLLSLHCFWTKSKNEWSVWMWRDFIIIFVLFLFDFVYSQCTVGCCSIVCLRLQVMQIKQVESKMSKKHFFKKNISGFFCTTTHTRM